MTIDLKAKYEAYIRERSETDKASLEIGKHYDTWFLTLTGGALLISVTFVEKIAPNPAPYSLCFLGLGWLGFVIAIGCQLYALSRTATGLNQKILFLDFDYEEALRSTGIETDTATEKPEEPTVYAKSTRFYNKLAFGGFIGGLFFLSLFSICNLVELPNHQSKQNLEDTMSDKKPLNESRGTYVPSPAAKSPPPAQTPPPQPATPSASTSTPAKPSEPPKK